MESEAYVVATVKPWNIRVYNEVVRHYPGRWHLITEPGDLTPEKIRSITPAYVFFPHWQHLVAPEILRAVPCVCFHETDLPRGRGGSPVQNLIARGYRETVISALRMTEELDAGPIYLKRPLSLEGIAEEIFLRAAYLVADMIKIIITDHPTPRPQVGEPTFWARRRPEQSRIPERSDSLRALFDHIRMLDADGYPRAFLESGGYRYEITRPALRADGILADVRITRMEGEGDD